MQYSREVLTVIDRWTAAPLNANIEQKKKRIVSHDVRVLLEEIDRLKKSEALAPPVGR